jgi:hypothetical protein
MGLSTHAVFFDYDHDNDLDCYLLNNSFKSVGNYRPRKRTAQDLSIRWWYISSIGTTIMFLWM